MSDYVGFGQCFLLVMLAICLPFALHMIGRLFDRGVTFYRSDGSWWGFRLDSCEESAEPQKGDE